MYNAILFTLLPLNILFHELGHIGVYLFYKINICAFVYYNNVFVHLDNNWKRIYVKNNAKSYVIPSLNSEYKLEKHERIIKYSILTGPIVSIVLVVIYSVIFFYNNNSNILGKLLLILNVSVNLSILHGCITGNGDSLGDIVMYIKSRRDKTRLIIYILDYAVIGGEVNIKTDCILQYDFYKFDRNEKIAWAYDVITLFLLGKIGEVPREITEFVCCVFNDDGIDFAIRTRYKQYLLFIGLDVGKEKEISCDYGEKSIFEKIVEVKGIEKKINERIGAKNEKNTRSC